MISLIDISWSSSKARLFSPPCDFIKFLTHIQSPTLPTNTILDRLESHIRLKIQDVFGVFCDNKRSMSETEIRTMFNFSTKKESDWRTNFNVPCDAASFVQNWGSLGIFEQRDIFQESENRIIRRLQDAFNKLDYNGGGLDTEAVTKLMLSLEIKNSNYALFKSNKLSFGNFLSSLNLLHRSMTLDILPKLEDFVKHHVKNVSPPLAKANKLRHEHFEESTNAQSISNPLHPQHAQQRLMEEDKQSGQQLQLSKMMQARPTPQQLMNRNILVDKKQVREHRRRASQHLEHSLSQRPTFSDLVERGILSDDNQQFDQRIEELLRLVDGSMSAQDPSRGQIHSISEMLKRDYLTVIARLNDQVSEYKQTLRQFQDDVHSREQRWRMEIENKQRVLLHMYGICDQQKADKETLLREYEEKIREIHAEYKERSQQGSGRIRNTHSQKQQQMEIRKSLQTIQRLGDVLHSELDQQYDPNPQKRQMLAQCKEQIRNQIDRVNQLTTSISSSVGGDQQGMAVQQYEAKISKQGQQIKKLKQQKKEMVALVNDKMATLKFIHQQELQKERHISNVLVSNHNKQVDSLKARRRGGDGMDDHHESAELQRMRNQMELMQKRLNQTLVENNALKKSKNSLERMVQSITGQIVKTAAK